MTIRWGIVSAGKISHDFVNAFNSFPDVGDQVIAAVAARDKSRADEFAKIHKIPKVFGSYNEMANSDAIGTHITILYTQIFVVKQHSCKYICPLKT